jgi:hypothetical protein
VDLSNNALTGDPLGGWGSCSRIVRFNLASNALVGMLPSAYRDSWITSDVGLEIVLAHNPGITGPLPAHWGCIPCGGWAVKLIDCTNCSLYGESRCSW